MTGIPKGTADGPSAAPIRHGGDLDAARKLFPEAPALWLDLSTGINPDPYPLPALTPEAWTRLPGRSALQDLESEAARAYGVHEGAHVVAAPGAQTLIQCLPRLLPARAVAILEPTYEEYAQVWRGSGAQIAACEDIRSLASADVAILVNPNNPDGRLVATEDLEVLAGVLAERGGFLVVDEAFIDVAPSASSLANRPAMRNAIVLRSFGKTYGLPGLRLGFAITSEGPAENLRFLLGPWAVSGPAIEIGRRALADRAWLARAKARLARNAERLRKLLEGAGLEIVGGTDLFLLATCERADLVYERLGRAGILVRSFARRASWLRFGIPHREEDFDRLARALARESPRHSSSDAPRRSSRKPVPCSRDPASS